MDELFKIANEEFYFDLDKISDYIKIDQDYSIDEILSGKTDEEGLESDGGGYTEHYPPQMVDITKWEVIKALLETILNENGIVDESMGYKKLEKDLSIPFRLSFKKKKKNKLIKKNG
jgi:hypothetical protein